MKRHSVRPPPDMGTLLAHIYEAAANPSAWRQALKATRAYLRSQSAMFFTEDMASMKVGLSVLDKANRSLIQEYYDHYIHKSPLLKAKLSAPRGQVTATNLMMPDRDWERHEFYYDFLRRCERFYEMGALVCRDGSRLSVLSLIRAKRTGGFTPEEVRRLTEVLPHISRAYGIAQRIGRSEAGHASLAALLDRLTLGVVLFDEQGRAVHSNRRAEEMFRAGYGLNLRQGAVIAADPAQTEALRSLVQRVIRTSQGTAQDAGGGIAIHHRGGTPVLTVLVTPLRSGTLPTGTAAERICAAMFLSEPRRAHAVKADLLRDLFGLTEAEAVIVRELANGHSPQEISRTLSLSWHTVRTQQRTIYDKLGVSTQSQLVKTVLSGPAVFSWPDSPR